MRGSMEWLDQGLEFLRKHWEDPKGRGLILGAGVLLTLLILVRGVFRWRWLAKLLGLEERMRRREIRRAANSYEKRGEWLEAARRYESLGEKARAADLALRGGHHEYAGDLYEQAGKRIDAALQYTRAQLWERAAPLFERLGQADQAADCYRKAHRPMAAAELYVRLGRRDEAARCYLESGSLRKAADLYAQAKDKPKAAETYTQLSVELAGRKMATDRDLAECREVSRLAAELWTELAEPKKAVALWDRAGELLKAGEAAMAAKDYRGAANYFRRANRSDLAAMALENAGDRRAAAHARAETLASQGKKAEAAEELERASDFHRAANMWSEAGDLRRAAAAFASGGMHREAGMVLAQIGDPLEAAKEYERAGAHPLAEQVLRKTGDPALLLSHFRRRMDYLAAGRMLVEQGKYEDAAAELQQVSPADKAHHEALGLLAHCFNRMGRTDLALQRFDEVAKEPLTPNNVRLFYEYACLLEQAGRFEEAVNVFERVRAVNLRYADVETRVMKVRHILQGGTHAPPAEVVENAHFELEGKPPDRYEIRQEISRGSGGVVYLALDTVLKREVAVKCLAPDLLTVPKAREKFLEEGRALAVLDHPNIVRIHDVVAEDGQVYLVTEYVKGRSLKECIAERGALPAEEGVRIGLQIAEGLAYAHARKVVHRDIKPANIALVESGGVKILDFGLAKMMDLSEEVTRAAEATICGTPRYMSPEQILGRTTDNRTDVYSFGATMYEVLTGKSPFEGGDLLYQHVYTPAPSLKTHVPSLPDPLDAVILRCLAKAPDDRFSRAEEIVQLLKPFAGPSA